MPQSRKLQVVVIEPRYIDRAKLGDMLARLFPPKTYAAEIRRGKWIISTPIPLTKEQIDACAQDLSTE
jgi:hypothetical protein